MTPEQRLDRLESIVKLALKAGQRERKETREKINALIDAQLRTEEAMAVLARSQASLADAHAGTDERLNVLINTVERFISERGNGKT